MKESGILFYILKQAQMAISNSHVNTDGNTTPLTSEARVKSTWTNSKLYLSFLRGGDRFQ